MPSFAMVCASCWKSPTTSRSSARLRTAWNASKMLAKLKPDILLLDLRMPEKDGLGVLEEVNFDSMPTRVIVLTAAEDDRDVVRAMRLGARGVVLKQSASDLLFKSIRKVSDGEIWLDNRMTAEVIDAFKKSAESGQRREKPLAERPRERNRPARRAGLSQPRNRRETFHQRADRKKSSSQYFRQARRFRPPRAGPLRHPPPPDRSSLVIRRQSCLHS